MGIKVTLRKLNLLVMPLVNCIFFIVLNSRTIALQLMNQEVSRNGLSWPILRKYYSSIFTDMNNEIHSLIELSFV
jgi:hypothetical protein